MPLPIAEAVPSRKCPFADLLMAGGEDVKELYFAVHLGWERVPKA